jgi:hypothetical protein
MMKKHNIIVLFIVFLCCLSSFADDVLDPLVRAGINVAKLKFGHINENKMLNYYLEELSKKRPRIRELERRIEINENSFGELSDNIDTFLYNQIDAILFKRTNMYSDGLVALRVVHYDRGNARTILHYTKADGEKDIIKTVWQRDYPEKMIDISAPLMTWKKSLLASSANKDECNDFNQYFLDGMPINPVRPDLRLSNIGGAVILERVTKSSGVTRYEWSIRSDVFTTGYNDKLIDKIIQNQNRSK